MIERAERLVAAEEVRPGMLVEGSKGRMTVAEVRVALDEVTLCGVLAGASPGTKRRHLDRHKHGVEVVVLAPSEVLDELEAAVLEALRGVARLAPDPSGETVTVDVGDVGWQVPLRRKPAWVPPEGATGRAVQGDLDDGANSG